MWRAALEERLALVLSIVALVQPSAAGGACTVAVGDFGHNAFAALVVEDTFYVSDGFQKVFRVPRGNGSGSELAATVVSGAMGLALDSLGRLFLSDQANGGVSLGLPGAARTNAVAGLSQPIGVLLDAQENLLVVEGGTGSVLRFDKVGQVWNSSGVPMATGLSNFPLGIAMGPDESLYIADTQNSRIVKWAPPYLSGTVLMDNVQGATGIAVDDAGFVYFTQSTTHRVLALHPGSMKTTLVAGEGGVGTGLDQLNFPSGLTIADGSLYIADRYNNRIVQCPLIASTTSTTSSSSTSFTTTTVTSTTETSNTPTTSTSSSSSSVTATTVTSTTKTSSSSQTSTSTSSSSQTDTSMSSSSRTVSMTTVTSTTGTSSSTPATSTTGTSSSTPATSTTGTSSSTPATSASNSISRIVDAPQTTAIVTTTTTGTNSKTPTSTSSRSFTSTSMIVTNRGVAHLTSQSTTTTATASTTVTMTNKAGTSNEVNNNRETTTTAPSKRKASGPLMTSTSTRSSLAFSTTFFQSTSDAAATLMTTTAAPSWSTGSVITTGEPGPERTSKKHALVLIGMTLATESVPPGYKGAPDTLMNVVSDFFSDFIAISLGLPMPPSAVTTEQAQTGSAAARTFSNGFEVMELEVKVNARDSAAAYNLITVFSADLDTLAGAIQVKIEALPGFGAVQIRNLEVLLEQGNPRLLALEEPVAKSVLPRLTNSSLFVIDSLRGGGTTVAANLRAWYQGNTARQLSLSLPGPFQRQVSLPAHLFHDLGRNGEELVLVVMDENKVTPKPKPWLVTGIVSISLYVSGQRATVQELAEPIEFTLNVAYEPGMVCVYWDETRGRWSMQGMRLSSKNTVGSVRCAVTHLTIFGVMLQGFLDAFFCSQFQLFSMAALASLTEMQWLGASGASFCLCLCFLLCVAAVVACIADRRSVCRYWSMDDLFLIASEPTGDVVPTLVEREMATENSDLASRTPSAQYRCCNDTRKGFRALSARCDSSAFREFIDEVFSHWFDNFGDLRMMIEDVFSDVRTMMARGYTIRIAYRMMTALLTRSSKRSAAASLRLSLESVSFVLADKELAVLLANRFERLLRADSDLSTPQVPWHRCMRREAAWAVLHAHVTDSVHSHMVKPCCRLRQCVEIFVMNSPLGILLTRDLFMSRLMRVWLHVMDLVGTLLITSLFYAASGTLKGKKKTRTDSTCVGHGLDREVAFIIGRHLAIAAGSVFLSALPVSLCASFITRSIHQLEPLCADWQRHLRVWRLERRMVWILSTSYVLLSVLFIVLFLANLGERDHRNWVRTSFLGIFISDAIVPLAVAIVGPSVAHASMTVNSFVHGGSIADMRQVAVKHLLQTTNIKLPGRIMV